VELPDGKIRRGRSAGPRPGCVSERSTIDAGYRAARAATAISRDA
jgi:hypothetical protein